MTLQFIDWIGLEADSVKIKLEITEAVLLISDIIHFKTKKRLCVDFDKKYLSADTPIGFI